MLLLKKINFIFHILLIKVMKAGKAGGPSEVVGEMLKAAGKKGIKKVTELCNQVVR